MDKQGTEFTPKWDIPDLWAANGHCPACSAKSLNTVHLHEYPDYLVCSQCEISFEVEKNGRMIRIKNVPDRYEFAEEMLYRKWLEASAVHGIIESRRSRPIASVETKPTTHTPLTEDDVWRRTVAMSRMGNKPGMIQMILEQGGATHQQAVDAVRHLKRINEKEARQQGQKLFLIAGISIFLLVTVSAVFVFLNLDELTMAAVPTQADPMGQLLDLIPDDVKPELLNLPDTEVWYGGVAEAECPTTSSIASRTFGGVPTAWRKVQQFPAWQMVSVDASYLIHVPPGMTAGYVENQTRQFYSAYGPAMISNVNFVVINCE